jgi:hypothetical protein
MSTAFVVRRRVPNFADWFNDLDEDEQNDLFGVGRAKLWRHGRISQSGLLNQAGRPLTLDELKKKAA